MELEVQGGTPDPDDSPAGICDSDPGVTLVVVCFFLGLAGGLWDVVAGLSQMAVHQTELMLSATFPAR